MVKIQVGMEIGFDQFLANTELFFQCRNRRRLVQTAGIEITCIADTLFVQIPGHLRLAMVGGQHDQGIVQSDFLVDVGKQIRQRTVEARQVVFGLQAGCAKQMADVVGG